MANVAKSKAKDNEKQAKKLAKDKVKQSKKRGS